MSYLFIDRYCKVTANLSAEQTGIPERGIATLTGWITLADEHTLLLTDENDNHTLVKRDELVGDIVVLLEQKRRQDLRIAKEKESCGVEE